MRVPERVRRLAPAIFAVLLPALLAVPALDPAVQLYLRDTGRLYLPVKRFIAERLSRGELPLWDPWTEAGTSLLGQVTPGLLHPWTLLYLALPFPLAFKLNHLLNLPLAAFGAWLLAKRLSASPWSAAIAAVAYGTCGFVVSMVGENLPFAVGAATVPLALWALLAALDRPRPLSFLGAAAALALCAYGGDPQAAVFAALGGGAAAVARAWVRERSRKAVGHAAALAGAWAFLAVALCAPIALPALAHLRGSDRAAGVSATDRERFTLHPARLAGLAVPFAFDRTGDMKAAGHPARDRFQELFPNRDNVPFSASIAIGAPALLLALFAAARRRGRILLGAAAILIGASMGGAVYGAILWAVPPMRYFRYAEKLVGPASLLLCLAAAIGSDVALQGDQRRTRQLLRAAMIVTFVAAATAIALFAAPGPAAALVSRFGVSHEPTLALDFVEALRRGLVASTALCGALALAAAWRLRTGRPAAAGAAFACAASALIAAPAALAVAPVELLSAGSVLGGELIRRAGPSQGRWRLYTDVAAPAAVIAPVGGQQLTAEVAGIASLHPQYEVLAGIEGATPYFSAHDPIYADALVRHPSRIFLALGVRFALVNPAALAEDAAGRKGFHRLPSGHWLREFPPSPRAWLVSDVRAPSPTDAEALLGDRDFDVLRSAIVEPEDAAAVSQGSSATDAGTADWSSPSAGRQRIEVSAARDALVVVSTHFDRGWRVEVDGAPAPVVRVDRTVLGVPVRAGVHRIELRFLPVGLHAGLWIAAAALASALAADLLLRRRFTPLLC